MADERVVLAIDTSTVVNVGLARGGKVLATATIEDRMAHVEQLTPLIRDVLRGAAPGHDLQLVVATGGSGADQSLVAVPFDEIQIDSDGDELYTNRSREQLAATPVALDHRSHTPRPGAAGQRDAASSSQQRIGDLLGAQVVGSSGDKVGEVDDIVISTAGADSIRAVLQIGGVSGLGEKRISLPLSQFAVERVGDDEPALRVAMDREALERMPEFEYEEQTAAL